MYLNKQLISSSELKGSFIFIVDYSAQENEYGNGMKKWDGEKWLPLNLALRPRGINPALLAGIASPPTHRKLASPTCSKFIPSINSSLITGISAPESGKALTFIVETLSVSFPRIYTATRHCYHFFSDYFFQNHLLWHYLLIIWL